jgi:hypothetical protein
MRGVSERCFGTVLTVRVEVQEECWTCMYKEAKQQLKQLIEMSNYGRIRKQIGILQSPRQLGLVAPLARPTLQAPIKFLRLACRGHHSWGGSAGSLD